MRAVVLCWIARFVTCLVLVNSATAADYEPSPGLRRPVALALAENDSLLLVANRSGTISIIDTRKEQIHGEFTAGSRLADIVIHNNGTILIADEARNELLLVSRSGTKLSKVASIQLPAHPVKVAVSRNESFVALLWARAIAVVDVSDRGLKLRATIPLPFAPREMLVVNESLIVADAFGSKLAVVVLARREVESVRTLPAHNIRGLALSADGQRLYVAHQTLSPLARTTSDDIRWGNLIGNHVRSLAIRNVLNPDADLLKDSELHFLGDEDNGAGDPGPLAVSSDKLLVASSGTGEIFFSDQTRFRFWRLGAGRHPTAITSSKDNERAYIADMSADQILVADLNKRGLRGQISLGPQRALTPTERGEELFYDARLSHKGWLSCHSCHTDGHSNGLLSDTLGDGSFGAPKRVLSLLGVGETGPWGWNGSFTTLEAQVQQSIHSTMGGSVPSQEDVACLTAYLKSLKTPPAFFNATATRGQEVFNKRCAECHEPSTYTSGRTYEVGLGDEVGNTRFNPPSLRGVSQRDRYFHDNRAKTSESVFVEFNHGFDTPPSSGDLAELLKFLATL